MILRSILRLCNNCNMQYSQTAIVIYITIGRNAYYDWDWIAIGLRSQRSQYILRSIKGMGSTYMYQCYFFAPLGAFTEICLSHTGPRFARPARYIYKRKVGDAVWGSGWGGYTHSRELSFGYVVGRCFLSEKKMSGERAPMGTWSATCRNSRTDALLGDSRHQIIGERMVGNCALGSQMAGAMLLGHCGGNRALLGWLDWEIRREIMRGWWELCVV